MLYSEPNNFVMKKKYTLPEFATTFLSFLTFLESSSPPLCKPVKINVSVERMKETRSLKGLPFARRWAAKVKERKNLLLESQVQWQKGNMQVLTKCCHCVTDSCEDGEQDGWARLFPNFPVFVWDYKSCEVVRPLIQPWLMLTDVVCKEKSALALGWDSFPFKLVD